jgi:exopolysaccharide biosynthesis predicted pyruvyltransferase EpsI
MFLVFLAEHVFLDHIKGPKVEKDKTAENFDATKLSSKAAENAALRIVVPFCKRRVGKWRW